jgi:hypothetical protein
MSIEVEIGIALILEDLQRTSFTSLRFLKPSCEIVTCSNETCVALIGKMKSERWSGKDVKQSLLDAILEFALVIGAEGLRITSRDIRRSNLD